MKPQLVQKGKEQKNPNRQMKNAMKPTGTSFMNLRSWMTVIVAWRYPKDESRPSRKMVALNMMDQKFDHGIKSQAVG